MQEKLENNISIHYLLKKFSIHNGEISFRVERNLLWRSIRIFLIQWSPNGLYNFMICRFNYLWLCFVLSKEKNTNSEKL